jgi:sugar phosphate permease
MNRVQLILILALLTVVALLSAAIPPACTAWTFYYAQGNLASEITSIWNTARTGGGATPANFTSGDVFVMQNGRTRATLAIRT